LDHPILKVVSPIECKGRDHLNSFFNEICVNRPYAQRGEGVVLRDPKAWYFKEGSFLKKEVSAILTALLTTIATKGNDSNEASFRAI
jgi:hypothetical protein